MAGVDVMWTFSVQGFSIPSHKLAQCEKGAPSLNPPACMICGTVRTCLRIAQKKHANSVGGRGISAFSCVFFNLATFFHSLPRGEENSYSDFLKCNIYLKAL